MDAEKLAMQRRIDNLQRHIDYLYGELRDYERQTAKLTVELEAVKRERDALMCELLKIVKVPSEDVNFCLSCKHSDGTKCLIPLAHCGDNNGADWEWRGVQENGGAEDEQG